MVRGPFLAILVFVLMAAAVVGVVALTPTTAPRELARSASIQIPEGATEATIEYVHDGDTLFLTDHRKVRLLDIDAPEVGDNLECYGTEATALLRTLIPDGSHVWVLSEEQLLDQYGRSLLWIFRDDGTNVNLDMIQLGAAKATVYEPNTMLADAAKGAESAAKKAALGMWGRC